MKVLQTVIDTDNEGFMALLGETITVWGVNYVWTGKLVGVNTNQIKLENAQLVFETGAFTAIKWKDAESLPHPVYVMMSALEAYTVLPKN